MECTSQLTLVSLSKRVVRLQQEEVCRSFGMTYILILNKIIFCNICCTFFPFDILLGWMPLEKVPSPDSAERLCMGFIQQGFSANTWIHWYRPCLEEIPFRELGGCHLTDPISYHNINQESNVLWGSLFPAQSQVGLHRMLAISTRLLVHPCGLQPIRGSIVHQTLTGLLGGWLCGRWFYRHKSK